MPDDSLQYLGACIRKARLAFGLTQEKLSEQSGVSLRHIANIEKGRMNPSYEILKRLVDRLGISADMLFHPDYSKPDAAFLEFMGKYRACSEEDQKILLHTLNCLSDELLSRLALTQTKAEKTEKADGTR